jgi:hypothetical protein
MLGVRVAKGTVRMLSAQALLLSLGLLLERLRAEILEVITTQQYKDCVVRHFVLDTQPLSSFVSSKGR